MKISGVTVQLLAAKGRHVGMPDRRRTAAIIVIETDAGITGIGESYAGLYVPELVREAVAIYRPLLLGSDPFAINQICRTLEERSMRWGLVGFAPQVMSGIEMALWDLKGKALDVPVYELFGGLAHSRVKLYASAYASPWPVQRTAEKVKHYADAGFKAVKLATGFWDRHHDDLGPAKAIEEECEKLEAIRGAVGSAVDICLDHHGANNVNVWSSDAAVQIVQSITH